MDFVLDTVFVLAVVAFVKEQFKIKGTAVLIVAFVICLAYGITPIVNEMFPNIAPFVKVLWNTFVLFLASAGSFDLVTGFLRKRSR